MRGPWAILLLTALAGLTACSPAKPAVVAPKTPDRVDSRAPERLAEADALVRAGCLDCLVSAFNTYDSLRTVPQVAGVATERATRTAVLAGLRERELGIEESGYFERARQLAAAAESLNEIIDPILEIAETMPSRTAGGSPASGDLPLNRRLLASRNRDAWPARLHPQIGDDPLSAYLWLGFNCAYNTPTRQAASGWVAELAAWRDVPLIDLERATCGILDAVTLDRLMQGDDRFVEVHYYLSLTSTLTGKLDDAVDHLQRAYAWRPRWPVVTNALANLYLSVEEFESAADFYDRTLAIEAGEPDALLGKIRALFYLGRYTSAIAATDDLIALGRWHIGEARYWRAFAELQLEQYDAAWADVEAAAKLWIQAPVSKLAGIIAYRRRETEVARAKFDESRALDRGDCETQFYLGGVLGELSQWTQAEAVLMEAGPCFERAERALVVDIDRIRKSDMPADRRERQIASREQQIASGRRMMATTWFNLAAACYNLSRKDAARQWAEKVATDEEFGARARDLLSRLK